MTSASTQNHYGKIENKTFSTEKSLSCKDSKNEALAALLVKWPWYGQFSMALSVVETEQVPVAACGWNPGTGQGTLYFHPENFPKFDLKTRLWAIAHEITHWTNLHCKEAKGGMLVNVAMDMAVNSLLSKMGLDPTHPDEFITVENVYKKYLEIEPGLSRPENCMSWEYYYNWLLDRKDNLKEKINNGYFKPSNGDEEGDENHQPEQSELHPDLEDLVDKHEKFGNLTETEKELIAQYVKNHVENTSKNAAPPGELKGMIEDLIKACKPKVNWRRYLKNFIGYSGSVDISTTRTRQNKYGGFPKVVLRPRSEIAIFQDTSGSVTNQELSMFWGAVEDIHKTFGVDIHVGQVDTEVSSFEKFKKTSHTGYTIKGRGGTDMREIFRYLNNRPEITANTIVVLTDGDTPYPKPEDLKGRRVLWVITHERNAKSIPQGIGQAIWMDTTQK